MRISNIIIFLFLSSSVFAQTIDYSILAQPNVVWGYGEAKSYEDADEAAFKELGKKLGTEVRSRSETVHNNESAKHTMQVVSTSKVRIFNAKQMFTKKKRKYIVYRYLVIDDPYNSFAFIETEDKPVRSQPLNPKPVKILYYKPN